jgi:uncharacterized iron-regulated membrane protein
MHIKTIRRWSWVHKWTSLISMVFLLMLCITGLPLIFKHEIDHLLHEEVEPAEVAPGTPKANVDSIVAEGLSRYPGEFVQFVVWSDDEPNLVFLSIAKAPDADPTNNRIVSLDAHTGRFLEEVDIRGRLTFFLLKLHTDMFAGLAGKLFLGLMGLLFVVAIISGVVLYGPWMRKLDFGTVRWERHRMVRWLDVHNLLGAVTIVWALTVGFTGVLNTWADLILKIWQFGQLAEMTSAYKDQPAAVKLSPLQDAVDTARSVTPHMTPSFAAFPSSPFTSKAHYAIFMRGETALTSKLLQPVLVDASTGKFTDSRALPWYVNALLLSQPLHFGDYGGMPLKILWALLDILTIVVLITGLYLWAVRARGRREFARSVQAQPMTEQTVAR